MSSLFPVKYVDVRVFVHATEESERVLKATLNTLPAELAGIVKFKERVLTGHHGNPITLLEARIKDKRLGKASLEKLASDMDPLDKETLNGDFAQHLENGNLYIRLDKQSAYLGALKLGSTDTIHVRIHFQKPDAEEVMNACRRLGLLP